MRLGRRTMVAGMAALAGPGRGVRAQAKLEDTVVIRTTGGAFEKALKQ